MRTASYNIDERGMMCPECGAKSAKVMDSRPNGAANGRNKYSFSVRRRHVCEQGHKFTTYELNEQQLREMREQLRGFAQLREVLRTNLAA